METATTARVTIVMTIPMIPPKENSPTLVSVISVAAEYNSRLAMII